MTLFLRAQSRRCQKEMFWNWKEALESKGLKVNTGITKVMVKRVGTDSCEVCGRNVILIQCCAQGVETVFMANEQKKELPLGWRCDCLFKM